MPTGFKINLKIMKRLFSIAMLMLLMLFCFSYIFAAGYDFEKLSTLARQQYGEEAQKNIQDLQRLVSQLKTASDTEKLKGINDFFNNKITFGVSIYCSSRCSLIAVKK